MVCKSDVYKAFDTLSHESIYQAFLSYGIDADICSAFLREVRGNPLTFRLPEGHFTKGICQNRGVRQGGSASPFLFVLTLNHVLRPLRQKWTAERRGIALSDGTLVTCFIFADDIIVVASSWADMAIMMDELLTALKIHGLCIQPEKCCAMGNKFCVDLPVLQIQEIAVPIVDATEGFNVLGTILTLDNQFAAEIRNRIACAWGKCWRVRRWLLDSRSNRHQRLELWRSCIRPRAHGV